MKNTFTVSFPRGTIDATASWAWEVRYDPATGKLVAEQSGEPTRFELRNVTVELSDPAAPE